ncbi:MAG: efflux RND transporter periplasmic adaptor subunit [Candidatus Hydrogenedentes bacterium]|nr:efflux RND transporter periplasmic adaptor subunit [Candidatus Hydrogenedentota bacterium]
MLRSEDSKRPNQRVGRFGKPRWSTVVAAAATMLAAFSTLYAFTPFQTIVKERVHRTAFAAINPDSEMPDEVPFASENECVVRTQVVSSVSDSRSYVYSGEVRGRYESVLAFQAGGRIVKRNVQLGDVVHAGDVLMEIDPKDIKESVVLALAQVRAAESQMRLAEVNLARFQRLYREGAIAKVKLDQSQMEYDTVSSALEQASASYAQASNQLEYSLLRADQSGVIAGISAEVGQVIAPGMPVITLVRDGDREVEISIPENRIDSLRDVKSITVSFWALPGVELPGEIRETAPMADPILRTYKTRIRLLNAPAEIKLGMTASVRADEDDDIAPVRLIPLSAIYQEDDRPNVWVVQDGKLELRAVTLDGFEHDKLRVLNGLEDGDVVVTAGVHKLVPGQKVRVSAETLS